MPKGSVGATEEKSTQRKHSLPPGVEMSKDEAQPWPGWEEPLDSDLIMTHKQSDGIMNE